MVNILLQMELHSKFEQVLVLANIQKLFLCLLAKGLVRLQNFRLCCLGCCCLGTYKVHKDRPLQNLSQHMEDNC